MSTPTPPAVVFDIDGTLARPDHLVSPFAQKVVRRLVDLGTAVIVATGRTEGAALALAHAVGTRAPAISCNGAVVTDPISSRRLRVTQMAPAEVRRYVEAAWRADLQPFVWSADECRTDHDSELTDVLELINGDPYVRQGTALNLEDAIKVLIGGEPAALDAFDTTDLPALQRSLPHFFEASPDGARKEDALDWVLARLGIDPAAVVGFGDGDTDAAWLGRIGHPVAPAGAMASARQAAAETIGTNADDAVAHYLNDRYGLGVPPPQAN
jgi:Cof subfamily protein (haloacid dehalogenase superfamily)